MIWQHPPTPYADVTRLPDLDAGTIRVPSHVVHTCNYSSEWNASMLAIYYTTMAEERMGYVL